MLLHAQTPVQAAAPHATKGTAGKPELWLAAFHQGLLHHQTQPKTNSQAPHPTQVLHLFPTGLKARNWPLTVKKKKQTCNDTWNGLFYLQYFLYTNAQSHCGHTGLLYRRSPSRHRLETVIILYLQTSKRITYIKISYSSIVVIVWITHSQLAHLRH